MRRLALALLVVCSLAWSTPAGAACHTRCKVTLTVGEKVKRWRSPQKFEPGTVGVEVRVRGKELRYAQVDDCSGLFYGRHIVGHASFCESGRAPLRVVLVSERGKRRVVVRYGTGVG